MQWRRIRGMEDDCVWRWKLAVRRLRRGDGYWQDFVVRQAQTSDRYAEFMDACDREDNNACKIFELSASSEYTGFILK